MLTRRTFLGFILLLLVLSLSDIRAYAHSMYQSAVLLDFHGNTVVVELQLPVDRLSISFRQKVDAEHFVQEQDALRAYVLAHLHPMALDGTPFAISLQSMAIQSVEGAPYLVVHLTLVPPAKSTVNRFILNYDVITHEIVTHVVLVSIRSDDRNLIAAGDPVLVGVIRGERRSLVVDRFEHV